MTTNIVHTIVPGAAIPLNYFSENNVLFIQNRIAQVLSRHFIERIIIDKASIIRTMQFVLSERREPVPKLNQRVVMYICDDYRNHQQEVNRNLNWEENYSDSQKLVDMSGQNLKFDKFAIKTTDQVKYDGKTRAGGSLRFYFT